MVTLILTSDLHYGFEGRYTEGRLARFYRELQDKKPDILVIAGDLSQGVEYVEPCSAQLREHFPELPVLAVLGNHDYWGTHKPNRGFIGHVRRVQDVLKNYNIYYLPTRGPFIFHDHIFYGFDGWYWSSSPPTNDQYFMPKSMDDVKIHDYMYMRSRYDAEHILKTVEGGDGFDREHRYIVTHFEPNDSLFGGNTHWLDPFSLHFSNMLTGHMHKKAEYDHANSGCRMTIHNSGSDYNEPRSKIIEFP